MKNYRYVERRNRLIKTIALWVGEIAGAILLAAVMVHFCFQIITVHGNSMQPAYYDGDVVLINKLNYHTNGPKRYDAAVFELENGSSVHYTLKRVIGLPGEKVQITDGILLINGKEINYFPDIIMSAGLAAYEVELGEDEYFVMGDNCNNSEDSRVANIGNVKKEQFVGKVTALLRGGRH